METSLTDDHQVPPAGADGDECPVRQCGELAAGDCGGLAGGGAVHPAVHGGDGETGDHGEGATGKDDVPGGGGGCRR